MEIIDRASASSAGKTCYFTAAPCNQGHLAERFVKSGACTVCSKEATQAWRSANKDRVKALDDARRKASPSRGSIYKKAWKHRNPQKNKNINDRYRAVNSIVIAEKAKTKRSVPENIENARRATNEWRLKNPAKAAAYVSARRCNRLMATPPWADMSAILEIYEEAVAKGMTVDHIIPLTSKLVCGLHVQNNLRVIDGRENSRKGNKFNPDEFSYPIIKRTATITPLRM